MVKGDCVNVVVRIVTENSIEGGIMEIMKMVKKGKEWVFEIMILFIELIWNGWDLLR